MALSDEWEEMHLTPHGWVQGSTHYDNGKVTDVAPPPDAVQTVRRRGTIAAGGAPYKANETVKNRIDDTATIEQLRAQFGAPTFGV